MNKNQGIMLACSGLLLPFALQGQTTKKPNIIYIMCDDMGYGDLGCYGQQFISTPNIDRMAANGMRFTQAYCGCPVSAPSRCSFMTGQHTGHAAVRGNKEYWSGSITYGVNTEYTVTGQHPYDTAHVIIPEILKDNGYTTGMFGKWAAGYEGSAFTPDKQGIDEYYGYICQFQAHLYYPNFLNRYSKSLGDNGTIRVILNDNIKYPMYGDEYAKRTQYSADLIHGKAMEWLEKQTPDQPFLGIFTYTIPHAELYGPRDSILAAYDGHFCVEKAFSGAEGSRYNPNNNSHAQFAAMITRLDTQVGQILALLEKKGLLDNTLVIFTSDNGPHEEGGGDPSFFNRDGLLRGVKRSMYEGGIRIPFIAYWPGHVPAGVTCDLPFAFYDLMPTFCDLAGIDNYAERYRNKRSDYTDYFDGISIAPTLLGNYAQQKKHDYLYWELSESNSIGVRKGDWKLVVESGTTHLYDLATDIHEDNDIKAQYPEVLKEMINIVYECHTPNAYFSVTLPTKIN